MAGRANGGNGVTEREGSDDEPALSHNGEHARADPPSMESSAVDMQLAGDGDQGEALASA